MTTELILLAIIAIYIVIHSSVSLLALINIYEKGEE